MNQFIGSISFLDITLSLKKQVRSSHMLKGTSPKLSQVGTGKIKPAYENPEH